MVPVAHQVTVHVVNKDPHSNRHETFCQSSNDRTSLYTQQTVHYHFVFKGAHHAEIGQTQSCSQKQMANLSLQNGQQNDKVKIWKNNDSIRFRFIKSVMTQIKFGLLNSVKHVHRWQIQIFWTWYSEQKLDCNYLLKCCFIFWEQEQQHRVCRWQGNFTEVS